MICHLFCKRLLIVYKINPNKIPKMIFGDFPTLHKQFSAYIYRAKKMFLRVPQDLPKVKKIIHLSFTRLHFILTVVNCKPLYRLS